MKALFDSSDPDHMAFLGSLLVDESFVRTD